MCPSAETVIARISSQFSNINDVKKAFLKIDVDKDGKISRSEMAKCGKFNNQEVDAIFILGDVNGDGEIDLEEFIGLMCPSATAAVAMMTKAVRNMNEAQQLFRVLDKDGDGMTSKSEWDSVRPTWKWLFVHIDKDKNEQLDRAEYQAFQDFKNVHPNWRKKLESR